MAQLAIGLGMDAFSTGMGLLQGHEVRAKDATNENAAAGNAVKSYDQNLAYMVSQVNKGTVDPGTAAQYWEKFDAYIEAYLQKQVGSPGTSWSGSGHCDKACTVGCCIYYNDLNPGTRNVVAALQQVAQSGGSADAVIPKVYGSKYGLQARESYTVTFTPAKIQSISGAASTITTAVTRPLQGALSALGLGGSSPVVTPGGELVPGRTQSGGHWLLIAFAALAVVAIAIVARK